MFNLARLPGRLALPGALGLALAALGIGASGALAHSAGAVYTLSNDPAGNAVEVLERAGDGSLSAGDEFATGGTGTGTGLGNQGGLVLDRRLLFAVNPGSDSISSFRVHGQELELLDTDASGGDQPISLTVDDGLLYVLNAGGAGNITGYTISRHGALSPLAGSTRPLSGAGVGPARCRSIPAAARWW
ncbi:MAG: beta-propeller fold lactonase family protein [Solirubrobacterales bacterium]|nr:beta-propeller fold lactonase family protein [Solirubrobacterales bacterium]